MSNPETPGTPENPQTAKPLQKPEELAFLSADERKQMQRFLSFPEEFPRKFPSWIKSWLEVSDLEISPSQVKGSRGVERYLNVLLDSYNSTNTSETTFYTVTIPGRSLNKGGEMTVTLLCTAKDGSGCDLDIRLKLGSTTLITQNIGSIQMDGSTQRPLMLRFTVINSALNAQIAMCQGGVQSSGSGYNSLVSLGTSSVDMSNDVVLTLTHDFSADVGQRISRLYASVRLFNPVGA